MAIETKHQVDKVYGVIPCCETYLFGCSIGTTPVRPSLELLADLTSLPRGSIVGIDSCDPEEVARLGSEVEGHPVSFQEEQLFYWKKIKAVLKKHKLTVAYLDDFATHRTRVEWSLEANRTQQAYTAFTKNCSAEDILPSGNRFKERRRYNEAYHHAQVEVRYAQEVTRGEKMLENIAKYRPQMVIISQGYTDYWVSCPKETLANRGLQFANYVREIVPVELYQHYRSRAKSWEALIKPKSESDPYLTVATQCLIRQHHAVNGWRINPNREAQFTGTWYPQVRNQGLFQMFIEGENEFEQPVGIIEDGLGIADFVGGPERFIKKYRPDQSLPTVIQGDILYESEPNEDGVFEGTFKHLPNGISRLFSMHRGTRLNI